VGIAISDDHLDLADIARSFFQRAGGLGAARVVLDDEGEALPPFWGEMVDLGWTGLHLGEDVGGQGGALRELAVIVEAMGAVVAPGPFLPHSVASALIDACGSPEQRTNMLPGLIDGSDVATVALSGALTRTGDVLDGDAGLVPCAGLANRLLAVVGDDIAVVDTHAEGVTIELERSLDRGRRVSRVGFQGVKIDPALVVPDAARTALALARTLASAEAVGGARAVTMLATDYAKERIAFGRVIGTFGPVKHHCANMLVDTELATAAAWDAARAPVTADEGELAAAVAASLAIPAFTRCAQVDIQVHGGIGYTFEHDAHLFLRRAAGLAAFVGADAAQATVTALRRDGVERVVGIDLPPEAEQHRVEVREFIARYQSLDETAQRTALIESGYLVPHWPRPWGRGAGAVEQIVIDEEFAGVPRHQLFGSSSWVSLTISTFGTDDQKERYVRPALVGDIRWCSLFSEPDAGSDAANVRLAATRVEGGWTLIGQKIWSSAAAFATHGLASTRTSSTGRKHEGITMVMLPMDASGLEIRPLRDISGGEGFCEVFFDQVFIPDDDVLGNVDDGWRVARATFGNERVSIGRQNAGGGFDLVAHLVAYAPDDTGLARDVGAALAEGEGMRMMNLRQAERAVAGAAPAAEGNITKLLAGEHSQHVSELAMRIAGPEAILDAPPRTDGDFGRRASQPSAAYLTSRGLTIGGGTSEITRNQIGERLLGLPRDPLLR
jgi:3-oxochol-4-en-24-oyl-CoA dehydrogenase